MCGYPGLGVPSAQRAAIFCPPTAGPLAAGSLPLSYLHWTCPGTEPVAGRSTETRSTDTKDRRETAQSGDYRRSCSQGIPVTLPVVTTREGMEARWACNVALDLGASPLRKPCTLGQPCKRAGSSAGRHLCCGDLWLMILWTALIHLQIHTQLITTR